MSRSLGLVLAAVLALLLVGTPASAAPPRPDPEVAQSASRPAARSAAKAPASVDSDVMAYALTAKGRSYFVLSGHLRLALKSGSTTKYKGSLVDYTGNTSYKASADAGDPTAPVLKLEGKNGKFSFQLDQYFGGSSYSGQALTKPAKLKVPPTEVGFSAGAHVTKTASYSIVLTERAGAINNPIEYLGTLTMAYDANGRISGGQVTVTSAKGKNVTHALKSSGYYNATYFYTVAQVDKKYFGLSATVSGTGVNGFGFAVDGSRTSQWVLSGTA